MRIGVDIRCLLDEPRSGVGEYTYNFLSRVLADNKKNKFILFSSGFNKKKFNKLKKLFSNYNNVEFIHLRWPNKFLNFLWVLGLGPKIDKILNVKNLWLPHFNFLRISADCRFLITCHDLSFVRFKKMFSLKGRFWHWLVNPLKLYQRADRILAISKATRQDLVALGYPLEKIKIIYPIVFGKRKNQAEARADFFDDLPDKFFFYLGTLDPRKNILTLLEAFIEFKKTDKQNIQLLIAGRLGWHNRGYYKKLNKLIRGHSDIKYLGYLPDWSLEYFYKKALAFVYPSFYEGFGFPPLEAMQNHCPVISSLSSSLTEVVRDSAYLVNPYNLADLLNVFIKFSSVDGLRYNLISKQEKVIAYWNDMESKSLADLVGELIS